MIKTNFQDFAPLDYFELFNDFEPVKTRKGDYVATFKKDGEFLFLRMELLTEENSKSWTVFKQRCCWVANSDRGVLSALVNLAGKNHYPTYERMQEVTGFTSEEYKAFTNEAIALKDKTENKIVGLLKSNSVGSRHMRTTGRADQSNYIVYISRNPSFSIQNIDMSDEMNLKKIIESYKDILITMGSDFSTEGSFSNRGISRNPYWVFKRKYSGLSMLLHGFTGDVADKYFPEKKHMMVKPVGSMQCIIQKHLIFGEGYIESRDGEKIDVTQLETSPSDLEGGLNLIKVSALKRIYQSNKPRTSSLFNRSWHTIL